MSIQSGIFVAFLHHTLVKGDYWLSFTKSIIMSSWTRSILLLRIWYHYCRSYVFINMLEVREHCIQSFMASRCVVVHHVIKTEFHNHVWPFTSVCIVNLFPCINSFIHNLLYIIIGCSFLYFCPKVLKFDVVFELAINNLFTCIIRLPIIFVISVFLRSNCYDRWCIPSLGQVPVFILKSWSQLLISNLLRVYIVRIDFCNDYSSLLAILVYSEQPHYEEMSHFFECIMVFWPVFTNGVLRKQLSGRMPWNESSEVLNRENLGNLHSSIINMSCSMITVHSHLNSNTLNKFRDCLSIETVNRSKLWS